MQESKEVAPEVALSAIQGVIRRYRKRRNSTGYAFYADTYGHQETAMREAQQALQEIEGILKRSAHTTH